MRAASFARRGRRKGLSRRKDDRSHARDCRDSGGSFSVRVGVLGRINVSQKRSVTAVVQIVFSMELFPSKLAILLKTRPIRPGTGPGPFPRR